MKRKTKVNHCFPFCPSGDGPGPLVLKTKDLQILGKSENLKQCPENKNI